MSAFDDLPPGVVLPTFTAADGLRLQSVQDTGQLHLADIDEAELAAIGGPPLPRQGRPEIPVDELEAARDRLVTRGLAERQGWALGRVRPADALLTYLQLVLHQKAHVGMVQTWLVPEPTGAQRTTYRISILIDVTRGGLACVERVRMPARIDQAVLPITVDLMRLDLLVTVLVATGFGDDGLDAQPGAGRETLVLFADGAGAQQPSRLRISGSGAPELETSRHGLLGAKTVRERVDREGFADHLRLRLMSAG